MHLKSRLPALGAVLLLTAPCVLAESPESPIPDPVAPAVVGRPLDQIRPLRPARPKPAVAPASRAPRPLPATQAMGNAPAAAAAATAVPAVAPAAAPQHAPKQALDDRVDVHTRLPDDVGKGTRRASKPLGPGAYFGSKAQALVRQYYEAHPAPGPRAGWKIGEPVPPKAAMSGVPDAVRARLPRVPPGHQYVQLDGEVVLVAVQSRMVVDGISRVPR